MKLSIGPLLFEWGKKAIRDFYHRMAFETAADVLYIGEVVCSKRNSLSPDDMMELAHDLRSSGKQVVFSTLGLVMDQEEVETTHRIVQLARQEGFSVEANDMAGIAVGEGGKLVAGPHITTYNPETVDFLAGLGVERVVFPVELSADAMATILKRIKHRNVEGEVFAFGRLPLTFSARCYTARAFHLHKMNCQFKCDAFPDGMEVATQDGESYLTINGLQTMSHRLYNLIGHVERLQSMGISLVRLSPQSENMEKIVAIWKSRLDNQLSGEEAMARLVELNKGQPFVDGYFLGKSGKDVAS
ncbi:MAG: U32 family peptidase [Magnetococcales bacterium]|nr:U32 family peptidase [Magnetococcales bacterium]NGZ25541.1 U32 family peptidase [Magnetococcales bacterium]